MIDFYNTYPTSEINGNVMTRWAMYANTPLDEHVKSPDGTKPRNDANYEKNYIAGRYGAIPYILND